MEIPRQRPLRGRGGNQTQDFLSLYSHPTLQPDPASPPSQGGVMLKTHNFLQPLERGQKENKPESLPAVENGAVVKQPLVANPMEHSLPGGIGTYSISHISYHNNRARLHENGTMSNQTRGGSAERNEDNSNCSSYSGSGFTLWEESATNANRWVGEKGFIKVKADSQEDEMEEEELVLKRESSSPVHNGDFGARTEGKNSIQKANTPRSKHSATEQRRRSKINDRFRMLREIIPQGDQKRDKASFLLEVIEYIQFLQVKVQKYEECYPGWSSAQPKLCSWTNNNTSREVDVDAKLDSDMKPPPMFRHTDPTTNSNKSFPYAMPMDPSLFHFSRRPEMDTSGVQSHKKPFDKMKGPELSIDGGSISISNVYSQGLLNSLTTALQSSGVDLSAASLSVQIDVGKQVAASNMKEATGDVEPLPILKKLKTGQH